MDQHIQSHSIAGACLPAGTVWKNAAYCAKTAGGGGGGIGHLAKLPLIGVHSPPSRCVPQLALAAVAPRSGGDHKDIGAGVPGDGDRDVRKVLAPGADGDGEGLSASSIPDFPAP